MPPTIDAVVPAYNHWDLTESCLRHLAAQTTTGHRVIVVDNGSTDGTRERLRRDWPAVTVVALDHNHPFTEAVNRGVAAGEGEIVVILNNDVDLRPDCLALLAAALERSPSAGSAAALLLQPGEERIDSIGITVDPTLAAFPRLQGLPARAAAAPRPLLAGPEGTTAAYRRAAWEQAGGFDERISAYMEIVDLALRLQSAGWSTVAVPEAAGVHLGSATFGRASAMQRRLAGFSRGYLLRRYGVLRGAHAPRALATEALVVAADAVIHRDAAAVRGRVEGWRAGRGLARHPPPPAAAIDETITLRASLALRRR
ncbi:MAG TPA: glycosyltransferase family 2 protein [Solirubrobacteraceae bacterium]|nr:glycosyltransferase family 2 protein [Solirubrobacteraceae bacterium]